ncbi:hypothetical protein IID23_03225 [Patescibacteria group bacterium]|nr:hypothetical protein [Patescibacteria group bacterium]
MKNDSQIIKESDNIRELLHNSTISKTKIFNKREEGFWNQLWTCLDILNQTEKAIFEFESLDEDSFSKAPNTLTYGLLQNLYVQQDALSNLNESIFGEKIKVWSRDFPSLFYVRDVRHITIGHPTKKDRNEKGNKYCVIDQSRLSIAGFSFWVWSESGVEEQTIKFSELLEKQRETILKELRKILRKLNTHEVAHKKKFAGQSLSSLLPKGEPYSFSVLRGLASDYLGWRMFLDLNKKFQEIKDGIEERYGKLNQALRVPGTKILIDELERIFQRIEEMKYSGSEMEIDLNIYADALVERLKELKMHLDEIDDEFKIK